MLALRQYFTWALVLTVTLSFGTAFAQDADADSAKADLEKGIQLFKDLDFKEAKAAFLSVDRDLLDEDDQDVLDDYIVRSDEALTAQMADMEAFNDAEEARGEGRWDDARKGYAQAAASEFLPEQMRTTAKAQLAVVNDRAAAAGDDEDDDSFPGPGPTADDEDNDAEVPVQRVVPANIVAQADDAGDFGTEAITAPDTDMLNAAAVRRALRQQQIDAEFNKAIAQAKAFRATDDKAGFASARDAIRVAQNIVDNNRTTLTEDQYNKYRIVIEAENEAINERETWLNEKAVGDQVREIEKMRADRERALEVAKQADIANRIEAAKIMIKQNDFEGAFKTVEGILAIDPRNSWALNNYLLLQQYRTMRAEKRYNDQRIVEEQAGWVAIREAEIPWDQVIRYPSSWMELTRSRERFRPEAANDSPENAAMRLMLLRPLVAVEFQEQPLEKVIQWLRDVTGANLTVDRPELEGQGIQPDVPITLRLRQVKFETVLKQVLEQAGGSVPLGYVVDDGVIRISTREKLARNTIIRTYDISDLLVRVPNFAGPELDLTNAQADNNGSSSTNVDPWANAGEGNGGEGNVPTKDEMVQQIMDMISNSVEPESWRDRGGTTGTLQALQSKGQLIIGQTQEAHEQIADLLKSLRESNDMQINIEARFISVNSGFLESIGLNLDLYFNLGGNGTITDPQTGAIINAPFPGPGWTGRPGSSRFAPMGVLSGGNSSNFTSMRGAGTGVSSSLSGPSISLGGAFLDDIQVNFLIQATQASAYTRTLVAPRLTLFNGQRAYLALMTQQAYIGGYDATVSDNASVVTPTISILSSGTVLDVEGTISADRRYVTLTVRPTVTTLDQLFETSVAFEGNGAVYNRVIQLPLVTIQTLETTVIVPDRGTLLLGGQRVAMQVEREQGVPLLSKIPVVNRLFTNRGMVRDESTLLILIKPTIIIKQESEEEAFPGTMNL